MLCRRQALALLPLASLLLAAACDGRAADIGSFGLQLDGDAPPRRLTRFEYNNTVRDLLGDDSRPADSFPKEEVIHGFDNQVVAQSISPALAGHLIRAAEDVAARAAQNKDLLPCDPVNVGDLECAREFIDSFGERAYRRPLDDGDRERLLRVFQLGVADGGFAGGIELVVQAALMSPHFLYRVERPGVATDWHVASRLSYLLWGSMPDDELFEAARGGELRTAAQIEAQARRMLADTRIVGEGRTRAQAMVAHFYRQWLELDRVERIQKDRALFPGFAGVRSLLKRETETFLDHVIWAEGGSLEEIFTANYTFMNGPLAKFYGIEGGPTGDAFERVSLDEARRIGLLSHSSLLAMHAHYNQSSPIHRGKFVLERLLCEELPPPPDDIVIRPPKMDANLTTRERFAQHSKDPACQGCHELMDPIGFGFENFDAVGLWREEENGAPVDASGELYSEFSGVVDLAYQLTDIDELSECVVRHWFRYAYGRDAGADDRATLAELNDQFAASGYSMRDLVLALTRTRVFEAQTEQTR